VTYIGQQPSTTFDSGIQDRFTGLSSNTVTLTHDISAETDILVVWNNIVQDSGTYSVGGTGNKTLTLGGTLVSADVVTVYYLNKVMQSVNPTAGSVNTTQLADLGVTGAKLNTDVISAQTALGATPADTDELLVSDAGVLKRVDYSYIKGALNTPIIQVYLSGNQTLTNGQFDKITFDSETYDTGSNFASNKFTVPSDGGGYYYIELKVDFDYGTEVPNDKKCKIVQDGSTNLSEGFMNGDGHPYGTVSCSTIVNLSATDYIEGFAYVQNGTASFAKSGSAYTQMKIFKLGS